MSTPFTGVTKSAPEILSNMVANYEGLAERTLAPADPTRFLLGAVATALAQAHSLIDFNARSNLIRHSRGEYLDEVVALHGVTRLPASKASALVNFALAAERESVVPIPAGTRVTTLAGAPVFATTVYTEIAAGDTSVDVAVECTEEGKQGNDYTEGQISVLSDPIAYVVSVANTETTAGGDDEEEDEDLQDRAILALDALSVAGPGDAYEALAKSANPSIIDVYVANPSPGEIVIYPLLEGGEIPVSAVLEQVEAACSPKTVRPLTDSVTVSAPSPAAYDIEVHYYLPTSVSGELTAAQERVEEAVEEYRLWQRSKLGRNLNPSKLIAYAVNAGASKIEDVLPVHTDVDMDEVAQEGTVTVVYEGLYDE